MSSTETPSRRRRQVTTTAAAAAAATAPRAPAKPRAAAAPASAAKAAHIVTSKTTTTTTTKKTSSKCDLFRSLYSRAVWFDRDEVRSVPLTDVHAVALGFAGHLKTCRCSSPAFDKLLLASTYLTEFGLISTAATATVDKLLEQSEVATITPSSAASSAFYKSDFDLSKPASKFVAHPLAEPIRAAHLRRLIAPAVRSLLYFTQAFEEDNADSPLSGVLITNSFVMDKLSALFHIFTFYSLPQLAFRAASTALHFARRYYLEGKRLEKGVCFSSSPDEVLLAIANMCRLLLRLGFIDAAFAFFRVHFPAFATFSEADVRSILSYGQGQVFLLHIELNLRVRRYERIRGQLEAFLASPYIHQYTIKRYSTKIGALHLASQFPSVEYQFGGTFAEFLEPLNMVISMCKRWALFERLYPKSPSSTSTAAKVETTDPLWVRFATFNRLLETGRTSVHFNANSGQLMDAGFYFKLLTNLNAVTLNVVG